MKAVVAVIVLIGCAFTWAAASPQDCPVGVSTTDHGLPDVDADGVADAVDNCLHLPNCDQRDTDGDGFGNACDTDLNNDLIVNALDLGLLKQVFFTSDPDADFDGDGVVSISDLGRMRSFYFSPPGPTGPCLAEPVACLGPAYFEFDDTGLIAPGSLFVIATDDPATIYHGRRLIAGTSICNRSVMARIYLGAAWYNPGWGFHIDGDIWFFGSNTEAPDYCNHTAGFVQSHLAWWCGARSGMSCGFWCPWQSALVREVYLAN